MWCKRHICVRSGPLPDSVAQMVGPGCSLSSETLPIRCLKRIGQPILPQPFDEEIHASGHESVSPATILEHAEDAGTNKECDGRSYQQSSGRS